MRRQLLMAWAAAGLVALPAAGGDEGDTATPTAPETSAATPAPLAESVGPRDLTVDGMVGQIYGKPIYASRFFDEIGEQTLIRLGQTLPRSEFRARSSELINKKLSEWLIDKLRVAEAQSILTEREQQSLAGNRRLLRERLIAQYGGGVPALAEKALIQKEGYGLDEMVERHINGMVLTRYRIEKIDPHTDVNRREVERYYQDHSKEFNPPPSVTIRLIVTRDSSIADQIDAALAAGEPFEEVARRHSGFRAADGGLLDPFQLKGPFEEFSELSWKPLNEKVRTLREGQHTARVEIDGAFYWAKVDKLETAKPRTLQESFLEIETRLRREKEERIQRKLIDELLTRGNYTPHKDMAEALLDVAMVRYAKEQ